MFTRIRFFSSRSIRSIREALEQPGRLIVDVRTPQEVARGGGCEGAVNIPIDEFQHRFSELGSDKLKPIIFYCAKGIRSADAVLLARSQGFTNVFNGVNGLEMKKLLASND